MQAGVALAALSLPVAAARSPARASMLRTVPPAYRLAAARVGVPPTLLYGIALQESKMLWGDRVLPWLWTLNVQGRPFRYPTYQDGVRALTHYVQVKKIRNVDCGPMQINWRYQSQYLRSPAMALDAHHNLYVGATILARHYQATNDWFVATARYHREIGGPRAVRYAKDVYKRLPQLVLT